MVSKRVKFLCWLLKIKIIIDSNSDSRAQWRGGRYFYIRSFKEVTDMDVLHEVGHIINDCDCCRPHDEWRAHGFAVGMAKLLKIKKEIIEEMNKRMDFYTDMEKHYVCPRIERRGY